MQVVDNLFEIGVTSNKLHLDCKHSSDSTGDSISAYNKEGNVKRSMYDEQIVGLKDRCNN